MNYANTLITIGVLIMFFDTLKRFIDSGFKREHLEEKLEKINSEFILKSQKLSDNISAQEELIKKLKTEVNDLIAEADKLEAQAEQDNLELVKIVNEIVDINEIFYRKLYVISDYIDGNKNGAQEKLSEMIQSDIKSKQIYVDEIHAFEEERRKRVDKRLHERLNEYLEENEE